MAAGAGEVVLTEGREGEPQGQDRRISQLETKQLQQDSHILRIGIFARALSRKFAKMDAIYARYVKYHE